MYITGNTAALESTISAKAYKVFLSLCQYANNQTRECFVSKNTIARQCGLSLSGVVRSLRELVSEGLIAVVSRFCENGRQTSNRYSILDCPQLHMNEKHNATSVEIKQQEKVRLFPIEPAAMKLPALACRIYSFLTSLAGRKRECSVSRKMIAEACGITLATVTKNLSLLCREGFLHRIRQTRWTKYGNRGARANLFRLTSPRIRKLSASALRRIIMASMLASQRLSPLKNRAQRRALASNFPRCLRKAHTCFTRCSLTPSPYAPLTPQGTNVLTKVTVSQTGIDRSISEDRWKNIQSLFMRPAWPVVYGFRRGRTPENCACPFPSDYFAWLWKIGSRKKGNKS